MTITEPAREGARSGFVSAVWHTVVYWSVRAGIVIVAAIVILAHLHIVDEPRDLLLIVSVLILFLSEQLRASKEEVDKQIGLLKIAIDEQSSTINGVVENTSPRLYALHECVSDFNATLRGIPPDEKIVIEHLGLDLMQAWQYFEPLMRVHSNLTDVDYRLLILTDETTKIVGADEEVMSWSASVRRSLEKIRKDIDAIVGELGGVGQRKKKKLRYEVRKYWAVPVVHGFRIVSPVSRCYVAICRWGGLDYQKYEWGEPQYHKIN